MTHQEAKFALDLKRAGMRNCDITLVTGIPYTTLNQAFRLGAEPYPVCPCGKDAASVYAQYCSSKCAYKYGLALTEKIKPETKERLKKALLRALDFETEECERLLKLLTGGTL